MIYRYKTLAGTTRLPSRDLALTQWMSWEAGGEERRRERESVADTLTDGCGEVCRRLGEAGASCAISPRYNGIPQERRLVSVCAPVSHPILRVHPFQTLRSRLHVLPGLV